MNSDLCDVCGCRGAGGFRGDGLSAQQRPRVRVTISFPLVDKQNTVRFSGDAGRPAETGADRRRLQIVIFSCSVCLKPRTK